MARSSTLMRLAGPLGLAGVLLLTTPAHATCWHQRDGKGYCCQAPGGPASCHRYTPEQLRQRDRERRLRERKAAEEAERRRRAAEAAERARQRQRERDEQRRRERERADAGRRRALEELRQRDPAAYQRRLERERQRRLRRQRQREEWRRNEQARRERRRRLQAQEKGMIWWSPGLGFEYGLGPSLRLTSASDVGVQVGPGLAVSVGLFYRRSYVARAMIGSQGSLALAAVPLMGPLMAFFLVPKSAFLGNELGLGVAAQLGWATADRDRFRVLVLLEPRLRVSPTWALAGSRWRFNSLLGVLVPKVGLEIASDGTHRWALELYNLSYAFAIDEHFALELGAAMTYRWGKAGEKNAVGFNARLQLLVF